MLFGSVVVGMTTSAGWVDPVVGRVDFELGYTRINSLAKLSAELINIIFQTLVSTLSNLAGVLVSVKHPDRRQQFHP